MGDISVKGSDGSVLYTIQTDPGTGKVQDVKPAPGTDPADAAKLKDILNGVDLGTSNATWELDHLMKNLGQINPLADSKDLPKDAKDVAKRAELLDHAITDLKSKLATAEAATPQDKGLIKKLTNSLALAENQLKSLFTQLKGVAGESDFPSEAKALLNSLEASHDLGDKAAPTGGGKAQVASSNPQASNAPQQPYPGAGKAQTGPGAAGGFDLNKVLQSSMFQTMGLNSLDTLGKNQMDQKKMMMLFMYFASMAMSGDIGAMTSFMQFITTIITKDKAMQNVNMANKLIELEDASRKATDELLNTPSFDPNNPQVGADFSKTMEKVKADQGSVATSQKLIAQMMEEFAQVSEFLNNLQKSLLDVRGRILSRMSSFNA